MDQDVRSVKCYVIRCYMILSENSLDETLFTRFGTYSNIALDNTEFYPGCSELCVGVNLIIYTL